MKDIQIGGFVSFTTIDYPGKLAAVLFLNGCPLRCPYCSNPQLLDITPGAYDPEKIFDWIKSRVGKLEAIVFSGGEALMQSDALIPYMKRVSELGFKIGLHTNGFYPDALQRASHLIDWIGIDYKTTKQNYSQLSGNDIAFDQMIKSLDVWAKTGKDIEVRITCDPRFVSAKSLMEIAASASARGIQNFAVQKYIPYTDAEKQSVSRADIEQFFGDDALRANINAMFQNVIWRE